MNGNLIWMDLEMTGLDPENAVIVEIATLVTDAELHILAQGPNIAIAHPDHVLHQMDEWSRQHHEASGLLKRIYDSSMDTGAAESATLEFLSQYCADGACPLCGNSVWQDRRFLVKYMPRLNNFLHHRVIDVSSFKEVVRRWYPAMPYYVKKGSHTALADVHESLNELRHYRAKVFLPPGPSDNQ